MSNQRVSLLPSAFSRAGAHLEDRCVPAMIASFLPDGVLNVKGDAASNTIVLSRNTAGQLFVNDGAVPIQGGTPTILNTVKLVVNGGAGNDAIILDQSNGALPAAHLLGGVGHDTLRGGAGTDTLDGGVGNDSILGGQGNDSVLMGIGNDTFTWNPGDGSDTVQGQLGMDRLVFNGSNADEIITIEKNQATALLRRNVGNIVMTLTMLECIDVNPLGGADQVIVNDLAGSAVKEVRVNLSGTLTDSTPDERSDTVTVHGTSGNNTIDVKLSGPQFNVLGLPTTVRVLNAEPRDVLAVNGLGGNDKLQANTLPVGLIGIELNGGTGNDLLLGGDTLLGGDGNDIIEGGQGNDLVLGGAGNDLLIYRAGDGSDVLEGDDGQDALRAISANTSTTFSVDSSAHRGNLLHKELAALVDFDRIETLHLIGGKASDQLAVSELAPTSVTDVLIDVRLPFANKGDGQSDTIVVGGSADRDTITVANVRADLQVNLSDHIVQIIGAEPAKDKLIVRGNASNDVLDATAYHPRSVPLTLEGGAGNDILLGSTGNDDLRGNSGDDIILAGAGNDLITWNPGDGNDTMEGQAGVDHVQVNGSNVSEIVTLAANGNRLQFTRNIANVVLDINDAESLQYVALGGADTITVHDLSRTALKNVSVKLNAFDSTQGDGQADRVLVEGTANDDVLLPTSANGVISVSGMPYAVSIFGSDGLTDVLQVNTLGGDDVIDASGSEANIIGLELHGGDDDDVLIGSAGDDRLLGGDGDDVLLGGDGSDVLDGGAGDDVEIQ